LVLRSKTDRELARYGVYGIRVQPTALQTLTGLIIPCPHINTGLLKANEAKIRECGELEIVPPGHIVVIRLSECERARQRRAYLLWLVVEQRNAVDFVGVCCQFSRKAKIGLFFG
jgi:hypothetical protein